MRRKQDTEQRKKNLPGAYENPLGGRSNVNGSIHRETACLWSL